MLRLQNQGQKCLLAFGHNMRWESMIFLPDGRARVSEGPRANCYASLLELYICFYALLSAYICDIYIIHDTCDGECSQSARNLKTIKSSLCLYSCHLMKWLEAEDDFIVRAEGTSWLCHQGFLESFLCIVF